MKYRNRVQSQSHFYTAKKDSLQNNQYKTLTMKTKINFLYLRYFLFSFRFLPTRTFAYRRSWVGVVLSCPAYNSSMFRYILL